MNDLMLKKLIDDCGLIEDRNGGDYYTQRNKCCITQPGALKIQAALQIHVNQPTFSELGGRIVAIGTSTMGENEIWTTGEANPNGKAVEGSHPMAMAEKRFRVRAILAHALDPTLTAIVYGADEFTADWDSNNQTESVSLPAATQATQATPATQANPAPASGLPAYCEKLPAEWNNLIGAICELTNHERSDFELGLLAHLTKTEWKGRWYSALSQEGVKSFEGYMKGQTRNGTSTAGFALQAKKDLETTLLPRLRDGEPVELKWPNPWPNEGWSSFTIVPRSAAAKQEMPSDVPF